MFAARALRPLLALFVVAALLSACGGDDSSADKADSTEKSDKTTTTEGDKADEGRADGSTDGGLTDDPCSLLDPADLGAVTGIEFDDAQPGENSCTYTSSSGGAAIALNIADLQGAPASAAIQAAQTTCDAGTVKELEFSNADGGFGCLVGGVATVAATGDGVFAVLTGATINTSVDSDQIMQDLATILENAITGG
jgi:hypothetical protein